MRLYFIRHGRQCSTLCNVNVGLDPVGIRQAELLGRRLRTYKIDVIYSSDLIRAKETAYIINGFIKVEHIISKELKEIDFGKLTGLSDSVINIEFKQFLDERDKLSEDLKFPNGENGQMVFERVGKVVDDIVKKDYENVVIVTHGGSIRAFLAGILNMDLKFRLLIAKSLENCSITEIVYNENKNRFLVERVNDYAHIESEEKLLRKYFK